MHSTFKQLTTASRKEGGALQHLLNNGTRKDKQISPYPLLSYTSPACDVSTDELDSKLVSVSSGTVDLILLSVMLASTVVWQPRLSSLIALGYLTSVAICGYEKTRDTYWSGRTQPIGIDFADDRA
jgi:hypothetical protein